ncbi:outer membrane protein [Cognatishimia activa]|uniref:outer membrane protein n=1 Tax=Cognatishimia activa TaxID=1715691 RepID=UPI00222F2457|nr:hypothetical protein [Cognatishimia activa]UZD92190.1 hypothetical protein M0D42_06160 [Cognatishimia activa]
MTHKFGALALSTVCAMTIAHAVSAGSLGDPVVEAPISTVAEETWQGVRLGLTYNTEIASNTYETSEDVPFINGSNVGSDDLGGFLGYDFQRGNIVFGVELQTLPRQNPVQGNPTRVHGNMNSVRGRIGYATDTTLFYGSLGAARSDFDDGGNMMKLNGYVAGIGIERKLGKNSFVGFAVDHFELSGTRSANAVDASHTIAQLRIGFRF